MSDTETASDTDSRQQEWSGNGIRQQPTSYSGQPSMQPQQQHTLQQTLHQHLPGLGSTIADAFAAKGEAHAIEHDAANRKPQGGKSKQRVPVDQLVCRVEDCERRLNREKPYFKRYRCCSYHSKQAEVKVDGKIQRWCQQCCTFHTLDAFDGTRRNCRERLAQHNQRRLSRRGVSPEPETQLGARKRNPPPPPELPEHPCRVRQTSGTSFPEEFGTGAAAATAATPVHVRRVDTPPQKKARHAMLSPLEPAGIAMSERAAASWQLLSATGRRSPALQSAKQDVLSPNGRLGTFGGLAAQPDSFHAAQWQQAAHSPAPFAASSAAAQPSPPAMLQSGGNGGASGQLALLAAMRAAGDPVAGNSQTAANSMYHPAVQATMQQLLESGRADQALGIGPAAAAVAAVDSSASRPMLQAALQQAVPLVDSLQQAHRPQHAHHTQHAQQQPPYDAALAAQWAGQLRGWWAQQQEAAGTAPAKATAEAASSAADLAAAGAGLKLGLAATAKDRDGFRLPAPADVTARAAKATAAFRARHGLPQQSADSQQRGQPAAAAASVKAAAGAAAMSTAQSLPDADALGGLLSLAKGDGGVSVGDHGGGGSGKARSEVGHNSRKISRDADDDGPLAGLIIPKRRRTGLNDPDEKPAAAATAAAAAAGVVSIPAAPRAAAFQDLRAQHLKSAVQISSSRPLNGEHPTSVLPAGGLQFPGLTAAVRTAGLRDAAAAAEFTHAVAAAAAPGPSHAELLAKQQLQQLQQIMHSASQLSQPASQQLATMGHAEAVGMQQLKAALRKQHMEAAMRRQHAEVAPRKQPKQLAPKLSKQQWVVLMRASLVALPIRHVLDTVAWVPAAPVGSPLWWCRRLGSLCLLTCFPCPVAVPPGLALGVLAMAELSLRLAPGNDQLW